MTTQIVLVPGFWLGAWAWDEVAELLTKRGFQVSALTPTGSLDDRVATISAALDPDADHRILVVHSGAAFPGTMVIDQHPDLVDRLILVDTSPVPDALPFNAAVEDEFTLAQAWDDLAAEGSLRDLTDDQLDTLRQRAVPEPASMVAAPVHLTNPARHQVPLTVICTAYPAAEYQDAAEQGVPYFVALNDYEDVDYIDLPTGHWPMWSKPAELAGLIADLG